MLLLVLGMVLGAFAREFVRWIVELDQRVPHEHSFVCPECLRLVQAARTVGRMEAASEDAPGSTRGPCPDCGEPLHEDHRCPRR